MPGGHRVRPATPLQARGGTLAWAETSRQATVRVEMRFENVARLALWPAALAVGGATAALILTSDVADSRDRIAVLTLVVGLSWCAMGLLEWNRRAANRIGSLMVFFGFAWFVGRLVYSDVSLLHTIGSLLGVLFFAVLGHVLLAFPNGRLEGRLPRFLVVAGYVDTIVVIAIASLFDKGSPGDPRNLALVDANSVLADATTKTARGIGIALFLAGLARGAVAELVVQLRETRGPGKLRDALARALHDPSLSLAYWLPERSRYVDVDGRPVELPRGGDLRVATIIEREGRPVAALVHDATLHDEPDLVEAVGAAAGLALENERLQADLRARLEDLRASRARIVDAADAERRRLERNLHDGTQQRLVSVSMALGLAESKLGSEPEAARQIIEEARQALGAALHELREFSQVIHPAILTERGLGPALQELVLLAPISIELAVPPDERLPEPIEAAAYYIVAEALANVAKYACADTVSVTVERRNGLAHVEVADDGVGGADPAKGSGLRGLSDRVEALGGTLAVESARGSGTRLSAEIPCES